MNILLLGGGGREHALAWKLRQSPLCSQLFIAPGNAGTASCGTNLAAGPNDFAAIKNICLQQQIDLVVVGPEEPLVNGIIDFFKNDEALKNVPIIGPSQQAAQLEGSKAFAKQFMQRHGIPTAGYREFSKENYSEAISYLQQHPLPIVLKADGLAAGKGVVICNTQTEATTALEAMLEHDQFGAAGSKVVVEEFLTGIELSVFVLTDSKSYVLLPEAKDYKRIGEGDTGPNTGGMGAISPVPFADAAFMQKVKTKIIEPTIKGLEKDALEYKGFIFFGLIKVGDEPFVIEYNCRMGDPETEVVMPRLQNDLVTLLLATANEELDTVSVQYDARFAATTMAVSGGYPGSYEKGKKIEGLLNQNEELLLFQAGTALQNGDVVTAGGRVLCITALADTLSEAVAKSKKGIATISYEGMYYRKDIGFEFL